MSTQLSLILLRDFNTKIIPICNVLKLKKIPFPKKHFKNDEEITDYHCTLHEFINKRQVPKSKNYIMKEIPPKMKKMSYFGR